MRFRIPRAALAVLAIAVPGSLALWACGPDFPRWLVSDEAGLLEAPTTWLDSALAPLFSSSRPAFTAKTSSSRPYEQTARTDEEDLKAALAKLDLPPDRREALLAQYGEVRKVLTEWARSYPPHGPTGLTVPPGFPGEFEDYLRGAIAYHEDRFTEARESWEKLLARPAAERRHRSTWAAFMIGRAILKDKGDLDEAIGWFRKTRELAGQGFSDPLGLAAASLGWEALAEVELGRPAEGLVLYLRQMETGDPGAAQSIRIVARELLGDPVGLEKAARSPEARPIVTAYVLSRWDRVDYDGPLDPEPARKWLAALRAAGVGRVPDADRLAWLAYRAGDFDAAAQWLRQAPADAPMALWIRAKLALRAGRLAEAEALLASAVRGLSVDGPGDHELWRAYEENAPLAVRARASGELGAVRLARGEYVAALDLLARGGYWTDAAYVADRVLTLEELRSYVDRNAPASLAAGYSSGPAARGEEESRWSVTDAGLATPPAPEVAHDLRYLLGRRLARAGRYREARKYLPAEEAAVAREIEQALAAGRDPRRSAADRSRSLFLAACRVRHHGMEVLGTEIDPDWELYGGGLSPGDFIVARLDPKGPGIFAAGAEERRRAERSRPRPEKRFHYRYRGADLAWEAASLLPDGSEEKARILAVAGSWIENQDPRAADRFYKRLVRCCQNTGLGREADALRWFPAVDDCATP